MSILKKSLLVVCTILTVVGCGSLKAPVIVRNTPLDEFKYAYIPSTQELKSSVGMAYGTQYGLTGYSTTKSVNPSDIIAGYLIKAGYIIVPEVKPELAAQTVVINYGESGRRSLNLGYTIEITLQFISAKSNELVCSCTAEGQGSTEADDIRIAIRRALTSLFPNISKK